MKSHYNRHSERHEMSEKRSQTQGNALTKGVGARHPTPPAPRQGGGYLEIYTFSEFGFRPSEKNRAAAPEKDPRLQQLREIGLNHIWQEVAGAIGYDNFIKMWQILDGHDEIRRPDGAILTALRAYRAQKRYQRDRFGVLIKRKFGNAAAVERVERQMCEKVGSSHISRVAQRVKIET